MRLNEPPLEAAQREIREEVGMEADKWIDLGIINLDTSIVHCPVHLFVAQHLTFTQTHQEGTETIEIVKVPLGVAGQMVIDSAIAHAPSCVLILKALNALQKQAELRTD